MEQTVEKVFTYEFINGDQKEDLDKAAHCLAESFIGKEVKGNMVQEPMVGLLELPFEEFKGFVKEYMEAVVDQGYCLVAKNDEGDVVGSLVADINVPEIIGEDVFEGAFSDMNHILHVLEDVDVKFMNQYEQTRGKMFEEGEFVHTFMLGVTAEHDRKEAVVQLGQMQVEKAKREGRKGLFCEATSKKSMHVAEKYYGFNKMFDEEGNLLGSHYKNHNVFNKIDEEVTEGTYAMIIEF